MINKVVTSAEEAVADIPDGAKIGINNDPSNQGRGLELLQAAAQNRLGERLAEEGLSPDTLALLRARGHTVRVGATSGSANSVQAADGLLAGAADPRQRGTLAEGD